MAAGETGEQRASSAQAAHRSAVTTPAADEGTAPAPAVGTRAASVPRRTQVAYWTGAVILVAMVIIGGVTGGLADADAGRGPLSRTGFSAIPAARLSPPTLGQLLDCFGSVDATDRYAVTKGSVNGSELYACFDYDRFGQLSLVAVTRPGGAPIINVRLLEAAGVWPEVDPGQDFWRVLALVVCAAFLVLGQLGISNPPLPTEPPLSQALLVFATIPFVGLLVLPWWPGLSSRRRKRLILGNVASMIGIFGVVITEQMIATPTSPPNALVGWSLIGVGVYSLPPVRRVLSGGFFNTLKLADVRKKKPAPVGRKSPGPPDTAPVVMAAASAAPDVLAAPDAPPVPLAYGAPARPPPSAKLVDIAGIAAVGRRLHHVLIAIMFVAVYVLASALAASKSPPFTWPGAIVGAAIAAYLAVLAASLPTSRVLHDNRLLLAPLPLVAVAVCFELAGLSGPSQIASAAGAGLVIFVGPLLFRYYKAARALTDSTFFVKCMMTRPKILLGARRWHGVPVLRPGALLRVIPVAITAVIVSALSFVNILLRFSVPFIFDWLQSILDRFYTLTLGFLGRAIKVSGGEATASGVSFRYLRPADPDMWQMTMRGDLLRWGMIGPRWLSFDEFLTLELSKFGHVIEADESGGNSPRDASKEPAGKGQVGKGRGGRGKGGRGKGGKGKARSLDVVVIGSGLRELTATKLQPTAMKLVVLAPIARTTAAQNQLRQDWMAVAPRHADLLDRVMWQSANNEVVAVLQTAGRAVIYAGRTRDQWSYRAILCDLAVRLHFGQDATAASVQPG